MVFGDPGGFGGALDLAALDGTNGFRLDGIDEDDSRARSVSGAGDVNGDGFADLIVGAPDADPGGETMPVRATWCSATRAASVARSTSPPSTAPTASASMASTPYDVSGFSVSGAGDVNGDGFADLIVGAPIADPGGRNDAGESYVVFGDPGGFGGALDLAALDGTNGFRLDGIDPSDHSGFSVSGAGDVNGDGFADLIVGCSPTGGASDAGESYVVFGDPGGFGGALDLAALDGTNGFRLDGIDPSGSLGPLGERRGRRQRRWLRRPDRREPTPIREGRRAGESYVVFGDNFTGAVDGLGDEGDDIFIGTGAGEIFVGAQGDDTLIGNGGSDLLNGAAGDDLLAIGDSASGSSRAAAASTPSASTGRAIAST